MASSGSDEFTVLQPADEAIPSVIPIHPDVDNGPPSHGWYWIGLIAFLTAYVGMFFMGGFWTRIATVGLEPIPFLLLAILAYVGERYRDLRVVSFIYWLILMAATGLTIIALSVLALAKPSALDAMLTRKMLPPGGVDALFLPGGFTKLLAICAGIGTVGIVSLCAYLPRVRRTAAGLLPIYADSFVHATALATVIALVGMLLVPLVVTGQPPLLEMLIHFEAHAEEVQREHPGQGDVSATGKMIEDLSKQDQTIDNLALLMWLVPSTVLAVGYPFARTIRESLVRVGLVRPTAFQVIGALFGAVALAGVMVGLDLGIQWLWQTMNWPTTNGKEFEKLIEFAINPLGAAILGVVAGLGEELFARGVLQPRLGILLSNLFFTALHGLQYNWDGLLSVFLIGLVLGVVRKKTNTTTSAIVHGTFDFILIMLTYLGLGT
jgi:membrane protease YdiL (CAAX protease family)